MQARWKFYIKLLSVESTASVGTLFIISWRQLSNYHLDCSNPLWKKYALWTFFSNCVELVPDLTEFEKKNSSGLLQTTSYPSLRLSTAYQNSFFPIVKRCTGLHCTFPFVKIRDCVKAWQKVLEIKLYNVSYL